MTIVKDTRLKSEWMFITPTIAAEFLKRNYVGNRKLADERVAEYASDMESGKWDQTHQGLGFNENGDLIDGQHRLRAIVRSGVSLLMLVTTGISEEAYKTIDTGKVRPAWLSAQLPKGRSEAWGALIKVYGGSLGVGSRPRPESLLALDKNLGEHYDIIFDAKAFRRLSSTVRAAALTAHLMEVVDISDLKVQLHAFEHDEVENMTPKVRSLWKAMLEKRISPFADRKGLFTKCISAFDRNVTGKKEVKLMHSEERYNIGLQTLLMHIN